MSQVMRIAIVGVGGRMGLSLVRAVLARDDMKLTVVLVEHNMSVVIDPHETDPQQHHRARRCVSRGRFAGARRRSGVHPGVCR